MPESALKTNNDFVVKESTTTNILIGSFFLLLFTITLVNFLGDQREHNEYATNQLYAILLATFIPGIVCLVKGIIHKTIITVNSNGFYYLGTLKTNWQNFISAEVIEEQVTGSYQDNFVFKLQFYKPGEEGYFETKIPLRNTFDKSGEEIIAAIKYFREPVITN